MFCPVIQRYSQRLSMYIKLSFLGVTLKGFNLGGGEKVSVFGYVFACLGSSVSSSERTRDRHRFSLLSCVVCL